jgi:GNAT superfamily N-acetyltransferase
MTTVREVSVFDVLGAPEFPALIEEYAREGSIEGMPAPKAKIESYAAYDQSGMLHVFAAKEGPELVGFITVLAPILPHYSCPVAVAESFFVAAAHRAGGPGLRLLAAAEQRAAEVGSPGLLVCAPFAGRLFELLPKCGYVETNRVFFKKVGP